EVSIGRAFSHRGERSHTANRLETTTFEQEAFARAFFRAREHRTHHDGRGTCGYGFDDVAGITNAAVGDEWDLPVHTAGAFHDRSQLRHADARDDTCRAD